MAYAYRCEGGTPLISLDKRNYEGSSILPLGVRRERGEGGESQVRGDVLLIWLSYPRELISLLKVAVRVESNECYICQYVQILHLRKGDKSANVPPKKMTSNGN